MKVKSTSKKAAASKAASASPVTISAENFPVWLFYCGRRVSTASIRAKSIGKVAGRLKSGYFLLLTGASGLLAHPVRYDGKDVVQVGKDDAAQYVSLEAINSMPPDRIKAEVLTAAELVSRAKKNAKAYQVKRKSDDKTFKVVTLNPVTDAYTVGIRPNVQATGVCVLNMEPVAQYNTKAVQYDSHKDIPAAPIVKELMRIAGE